MNIDTELPRKTEEIMADKNLEFNAPTVGGGAMGMGAGGFGFGLLFGALLTSGRGGLFGGNQGNDDVNHLNSQFTATNANINGVDKSVAEFAFGTQKSICELGSKMDMNTLVMTTQADNNTQKILTEMANDREQALRDQLAAVTLSSELSSRGLLTATGPAMAVIPNKYNDNDGLQLQINNLSNEINAVNSNVNSKFDAILSSIAK